MRGIVLVVRHLSIAFINRFCKAFINRFCKYNFRRATEVEVARKLEEQEEKGVELEKTYTSLQQEVEVKTRKLRKIFAKLQNVKQVSS